MIPRELEYEIDRAAAALESELMEGRELARFRPLLLPIAKQVVGSQLPPVVDDIVGAAMDQLAQNWWLGGLMYANALATVRRLYGAAPQQWASAMLANRAAAVSRLAGQAASQLGLRPKRGKTDWGDSGRIRQYHRRPMQRGHVPGRNPAGRRRRELEIALAQAARELELAG